MLSPLCPLQQSLTLPNLSYPSANEVCPPRVVYLHLIAPAAHGSFLPDPALLAAPCSSHGKTFNGQSSELEQREGTGSRGWKGSGPGHATPVCHRGDALGTRQPRKRGFLQLEACLEKWIWRGMDVGKDQSLHKASRGDGSW